VALGQVVLQVVQFSPVSIIPPMFRTHLRVTLTRRTSGRRLGTLQKETLLQWPGSIDRKELPRLFVFEGCRLVSFISSFGAVPLNAFYAMS
jgi:hypothetical protein